MAPVAKQVLKMAAVTANKAVKFRRSLYKKSVRDDQKARVSKMMPGDKKLFGGKLAEVCKALKDGSQVCFD